MGSNGTYSSLIGGVPENSRSHIDTGMRIEGHKVLLQKAKLGQSKNILNSNSESPIYIIGHRLENGVVQVHSINIFDGHNLSLEINLKYDSKGNAIAYNGTENGCHSHQWEVGENGSLRRKKDAPKHGPIPEKYMGLIAKVVEFNKKGKVYGN